MNTKKVNAQMLEPQPTNGIRTIDTTSSQTIAKPNVSGSLPRLEKGDKIKLYGKVTTVTGFEVYWNDALEPPIYEIILLTTGRGDPFKRSLDVIEVLGNNR